MNEYMGWYVVAKIQKTVIEGPKVYEEGKNRLDVAIRQYDQAILDCIAFNLACKSLQLWYHAEQKISLNRKTARKGEIKVSCPHGCPIRFCRLKDIWSYSENNEVNTLCTGLETCLSLKNGDRAIWI